MKTLLLGPTGVDKEYVKERLELAMGTAAPHFVLFEKEYLVPEYGDKFFRFLEEEPFRQKEKWDSAWEHLLQDFASFSRDLVVALHTVYARHLYGCRSVVSIDRIKKLKPDTVVTLIDDVYYMWHRTQERAGRERHKGTPTIAELLEARALETFVADQICLQSEVRRNYLLAVRHPVHLLEGLLTHADDL